MAGYFKDVFGEPEPSNYAQCQRLLRNLIDHEDDPKPWGPAFRSPSLGLVHAGIFEVLSVSDAKEKALSEYKRRFGRPPQKDQGSVTIKNTTQGESRSMHSRPDLKGVMFQAASQFNCLEFANEHVTPEHGITGYVHDRTQGPACAIACAGGTAWRNYLCDNGDGTVGQTAHKQINGMDTVEGYLGNKGGQYWQVKNGYIEARPDNLKALNQRLQREPPEFMKKLQQSIKIGFQFFADVTDMKEQRHMVSQAYCSAISVGYSMCPPEDWERIARVVLLGAYEATLWGAVYSGLKFAAERKGPERPRCLLTKVGGGVFANKAEWIVDAIRQAVHTLREVGVDLDVEIVHFGESEPPYIELVNELSR